jgi:ubiquitin-protein ligase
MFLTNYMKQEWFFFKIFKFKNGLGGNEDDAMEDLGEEIVEYGGDDFVKQSFLDEFDEWMNSCPTSRRKLKGVSKGPPVLKLLDINTDTKIIKYSIVGDSNKKEELEFFVYYADYLEEFGDQQLSITKADEKLKDFVSILKSFMKNFDVSKRKLTTKDLLIKASEIYQESRKKSLKDVKPWYERSADEILEAEASYKRIWAPILRNFISDEELCTVYDSKKKIVSQLQKLNEMDCKKEGFEVQPFGSNVFMWRVKLFGFEKENSSLHSGLVLYSKKYKTSDSFLLEIYFTSSYPKEPPFVRIVKPRLQYLTGNVTFGGSFIEVPALGVTYSEHLEMISIISSVRQTLINGGAKIDLKISQAYHKKTAMRAFIRERRNQVQSVGKLDQKMSILSIDYARMTYGSTFHLLKDF